MSQFHRLPGFPSSYFGLDIITVLAPRFHTLPSRSRQQRRAHPCRTLIRLTLVFCDALLSPNSRCLQGNDSRIGFEDTLNDPYMSPEQPHTHKTMEQILKLPAFERDGAQNSNPAPFLDKI